MEGEALTRETTLLEEIAAACPGATAVADRVRGFAVLLKSADAKDVKLTEWITAALAVDLRHRPHRAHGDPWRRHCSRDIPVAGF